LLSRSRWVPRLLHQSPQKITPKESVGTWFGIVVGIRDLGVGDDVVVVVAEAAGAPHELAEDDVAERIAAPPLRVTSGLLRKDFSS